MPFEQYIMDVINDYCIVLNNKLEPSDRWHNLAIMSVSFVCLISTLWISALLLPCPWEIVLCPRKPIKGDGGQFLWQYEESNQSIVLRMLSCLFYLVFKYARWKQLDHSWTGPTVIERDFSLWQKCSCLWGVCWQYQWWVFPFVCQDAPNTRSGGEVLSAPSPRLSPPQQASLLFPPLTECSSSLIWAPLSSHFSLHCVGSADTGEKNIIFSSLQLPVKSFLRFCAVYLHSASAELGREGWETTKHIRPNYSASIRAFLSCLGCSLLTVRAVWLTRCADFKAVAQHRVNASNPNPSSFRQPGPNGLP